jgi:hypothetical protein
MNPGVYIITGGGFSVANSASVTGNGVMIYNAGSNFPNPGGTFGAISISSSGTVNLSAPTSGSYPGVLLFQARDNTSTISLGASSALGLIGTIYAPTALLSLGGSSTFADAAIVSMLSVNGNGGHPLLAAGAPPRPAESDSSSQLHNLFLYVNDPAGVLTADEHARLQDAIRGWDTVLAPLHVAITEVSTAGAANLFLDTGPTSTSGGSADGVLGSYTLSTVSGDITIVQGWNWYTGSDASSIGPAQYDFQTVVTHELGHALGLEHSPDANSVMSAFLASDVAHRPVTVADLNGVSLARYEASPRADQSPPARLDPLLVAALFTREGAANIASAGFEGDANTDRESQSIGFTGPNVADVPPVVPEARSSGRAQPTLLSGRNTETGDEDAPFDDVLTLSDVVELRTLTVGPGPFPPQLAASEEVRIAALEAVLQEPGKTASALSPWLESWFGREAHNGPAVTQEPHETSGADINLPSERGEPPSWLSRLLILSLVAGTTGFLERKHADRYFADLGARRRKWPKATAS